ncbi:aBC transporter related protein [Clostridium sp. CAG:524]|nr:aBC transporter related protein [Clostridium sp. CAG:524]
MKKEVKDKKKKVSIWKYVKKCYPYFKREKKALIILIIISLIISIFNSFGPALMAKVLDYATSSRLDEALKYLLFVVGLALVIDFFDKIVFIRNYTKIQESITNNIKKDVISSYFEIDNKELLKTSSGIFLTRITSDPDNIIDAFDAVRGNFTKILSNIFVFIYIFHINFVLGTITVIGTISVYLVEKSAMDKWNAYRKRRNKLRDRNTTIINEGLKGTHDIKLLNIVEHFKNKVSGNLDELCNDTVGSIKVDSGYVFLRTVVVYAFTAVLIVLSIYFVKFDVIKVSSLIAIFMYKDRLFTSILYLAWTERQLKEFALSAERIFEVIDHSKFKLEHYGNKRVNELSGKIEFKNVYFKYEKDSVLKGVSFNIEPKDTVAIVGKSGSGKTTIVNLISKIYEVDKGSILLDGNNINDLDKYSIRNNISVISQKPYLFNMTIKENLLLVSPNASQKQIENVCKICELHDYIMNLPKKYNTLVGEGGVTLSGGECQRVAIARALLMKTNIILFDEATSALDNETQENIQKAINNISSEYTMIIIAHRLSTIKNCNKIIVIDDGKVSGIGTHNELYKNNEIYKSLYEKELRRENG